MHRTYCAKRSSIAQTNFLNLSLMQQILSSIAQAYSRR